MSMARSLSSLSEMLVSFAKMTQSENEEED